MSSATSSRPATSTATSRSDPGHWALPSPSRLPGALPRIAEPLSFTGGGLQDDRPLSGSMRILHGVTLLAPAAALLLCGACGSSGGKASAAHSGSTATPSTAAGFAAYAACLRQHG